MSVNTSTKPGLSEILKKHETKLVDGLGQGTIDSPESPGRAAERV